MRKILKLINFKRLLKLKRKQRIQLVAGILVILLPIVYFTLINPRKVEAAWWDDNWHYRIKTIISNAGSAQTDLQVNIDLDTATIITAGKMQSDCDDIRITDVGGKLISDPYWIQDCNNSVTKIWIKFATIPASDQIFYIYYGNDSAGSEASLGNNVFDTFFEDFVGTTINDAVFDYGGGTVTQNEEIQLNNDSDGWDTYIHTDTTFVRTGDISFHAKYKPDSGSRAMIGWHDPGSGASWEDFVYAIYFNTGNIEIREDSSANRITPVAYTQGQWYDIKIDLKSTGAIYSYKSTSTSTWTELYDSSYSSETPLKPGIVHYDSAEKSYSDDWFIAKYASGLSTTNGSEEVGPGPVAHWKFDEASDKETSAQIQKLEQQIEILNKAYTHSGGTRGPTDNSLGMVSWDADKYSDATVYFEADFRLSSGIWGVNTYLYDESGNYVSASKVSTSSTTIARVRSSAITLTDDTNYTIQMDGDHSANLRQITAARLIIVQNSTDKITGTEAQIDVGSNESSTNTSYTQLTNGKIYNYDSSQFSPAPTTYLEANLRTEQPTIEQQINILDKFFTTTSHETYVPTDNSLGIVRWDANKYSNATVYFETVHKRTAGSGGTSAYAQLYKTDGTVVSSSQVGGGSATYTRYRSAALTLTDDTDYTVRFSKWSSATSGELLAARLIVVQTDTTKITDTRTQIEVGDNQSIGVTDPTKLTDMKIYKYDQDQFSPTPESSVDVEFHATLAIDDSGDSVYAELYNNTDSTSVSILSTTSPSPTLVIGTNVDGDADWDTTNDDDYVVRVYCSDDNGGGCAGDIMNAKIVLDQTAAGGITDVEVVHTQVNTANTDSDSTYTDKDFLTYYSDSPGSGDTFSGGTFGFFYEATIKTSAGTGYAQLKNDTTGGTISSSEVSTTSTSYVRQRSADIAANMPGSSLYGTTQNLDTQIKNSASDTTSVAGSSVVVQVSNLATAPLTAYADLYNLTDGTEVSGSEVTSTSISWDIQRSSAITLTTGKDYVVRLKSTSSNVAMHSGNAKVVQDQSDTINGFTKTELIFSQVNYTSTDTDDTYTDKDFLNLYDPANIPGPAYLSFFYEATIKTDAGTGYAQLRNDSDGSAVSNSEIFTISTSYERKRSGDVISNVPTGAKNLDTQLKNSASSGNTTTAAGSWSIVQIDKASPRTAFDSSVFSHNGKVTGPSWAPECKFNFCLDFDGTDDFVAVADAPPLDFVAASGFTIGGWFKHTPTSGTDVFLVKYESGGSDGGYKVYMESDGTITFGIDDDNTSFPEDSATTTAGYDDNAWHYLAAVKDGTTSITIYMDGELITTDSSISATGTLANNDGVYIGIDGDKSSNPFDGLIDEVKIYPYARSAAEIRTDYIQNAGDHGGSSVLGTNDVSILSDKLVGYFKMDETSANSCSGGEDSCDSSGYGNHADWSGNPGNTNPGRFNLAVDFDGTDDRAVLASTTGIPESWYDSGWSARKQVTVTNSVASELTNFQVRIPVTHDNDMQSDFVDLRFTNSSGTLLDYWLEDYTASTSATVWVEVDTIPASSTATIYMYYGNTSVSSASSGADTFLFIDEFNGSAIDTDVWTNNYGASYSDVSGGVLTLWSNSAWRSLILKSSVYDSSPTDLHTTEVKYQQDNDNRMHVMYEQSGSANRFGIQPRYLGTAGSRIVYRQNSAGWPTGSVYTGTISYDTYYIQRIDRESSTKFIATTLSTAYSSLGTDTLTSSWWNVDFNFEFVGFENRVSTIDWVRVREYATTDPSVSISGEQRYSNTMTVAAWVNADTLGATRRAIISRGDSPSQDWYIQNDSANAGQLEFSSDGGTNEGLSTTTLSTGSWYHVAMVAESGLTKLYINGKLDKETSNTGSVQGTDNISIGNDASGGTGWDGKIDEVRIYSKSLSSIEIQRLYTWGPGPVGYWPMDENTGTSTTSDKSANGNDGTLTSMTESSWVVGKYGSALNFDGSADYANVGTSDTLNITGTDVSVSAWIKTSSTSGTIFAKVNTASPYNGYALSVGGSADDGKLAFCYGANSCAWDYSTSTVNDGAWHHVEVVFDSTQTKFYIDGVLDITVAKSGTVDLDASGKSAVIGYNNITSDRYFNGAIDDVRVYNYARTTAQVIEDMNAGHPIGGSPISSMVGYWALDNQSGQTVYDSGFGGNNGTRGANSTASTDDPTWKLEGSCKVNGCLDFDGGDYIGITDTDSLSFGDSSTDQTFSFSAWVKMDDATQFRIISKGSDASREYSFNTNGSDQLGVFIFDNDTSNFVGNLSTDTMTSDEGSWIHLLTTYDGSGANSGLKLYKNGVLMAASDSNAGSYTAMHNQSVGSYVGRAFSDGANYANGSIDEIKIYNTALTQEQILIDMNAGSSAAFGSVLGSSEASDLSGGAGNPPVGEWKFDTNTGSTAYDTSGGDIDATINNATWNTGKFGSAMACNGTSSVIDNADVSSSQLVISGDLTISFWVLMNNFTVDHGIVEVDGDGAGEAGNRVYVVSINDTSPTVRIQWEYGGSQTVELNDSDTALTTPVGEWAHVVITKDNTANEITYYENGQQLGSVDTFTAGQRQTGGTNLTDLDICDTGTPNLNGKLDNLRIFDYEMTQTQVAYEYDRGRPVGWWTLDECQGSTAYDSSTNGNGDSNANTGSIGIGDSEPNISLGTCSSGTGTEAWNNGTTGKINYSLDFDGVDDSVTVSNATEIDFDTALQNGVSFAAWIYANSDGESDTGEIFDKGATTFCRTDSESGGSLDLQCSLDLIAAGSDATLNISSALSTNTWHHVAMTYSDDGDDEITVYVDGLSRGTSTDGSGGPETTDTNDLIIGGDSSNNFDGQIDDFRVYNYELSVTQIKKIMIDTAQRFGPATGSP